MIYSKGVHRWQGVSGQWYDHNVYVINPNRPNDFPQITSANYIFVRRNLNGSAEALYIGMSKDFDQRLSTHEKLIPALKMGMSEIHIHSSALNKNQRILIETDLRNAHPTKLNEQGVYYKNPLNTLSNSKNWWN